MTSRISAYVQGNLIGETWSNSEKSGIISDAEDGGLPG